MYGIELREIPRKESDGQVISASRVRKYLEEGKWENWHRGDKKMNLTMRLEETHKRVLELAHKKEV